MQVPPQPRSSHHATASNGTSMNRIALLVVVIEPEVEREPFDVCFMFQNRVVQENKRPGSCFSSSPDGTVPFFSSSFICKELDIKTVSKDANGANMYRILRFFADWIHVDRIGPLTDIRNTYVDNFTGGKTQHGSCLKECQWYQQVQNFKLCPYKGVRSWGSLVTVEMVCFHTYMYDAMFIPKWHVI